MPFSTPELDKKTFFGGQVRKLPSSNKKSRQKAAFYTKNQLIEVLIFSSPKAKYPVKYQPYTEECPYQEYK